MTRKDALDTYFAAIRGKGGLGANSGEEAAAFLKLCDDLVIVGYQEGACDTREVFARPHLVYSGSVTDSIDVPR